MYEQFSLIPGTAQADAQPPQAAQQPAAVKYYPIDEDTARRARIGWIIMIKSGVYRLR